MEKIRRYDLDWLRVIVFGLLIFYHVGMFFVPWGFHLKNNEISSGMRWPMLFLNQWRLPILFLISGMGTYYAFGFRTAANYRWERLKRLGIPLIFGMLVIIPPQLYVERLANQEFTGTYLEFWPRHAFSGGPYPNGNISWHHLWFLPYLLIYSLCFSTLFYRLRKKSSGFLERFSRLLRSYKGWLLLLLPLYLLEALMEPFFPVTHALIGDWFSLLNNGLLFLYGFLFLASTPDFWDLAEKMKTKALFTGLFAFSGLLILWQFPDTIWRHFSEAFLKVLNMWVWMLAILGLAAKFLNHRSALLSYCNRAVYPFYILHQSIMLILCYWMMDRSWSIGLKFTLLSLGTFLITWLLYHFLIRPIKWLHPLFGLKKYADRASIESLEQT